MGKIDIGIIYERIKEVYIEKGQDPNIIIWAASYGTAFMDLELITMKDMDELTELLLIMPLDVNAGGTVH